MDHFHFSAISVLDLKQERQLGQQRAKGWCEISVFITLGALYAYGTTTNVLHITSYISSEMVVCQFAQFLEPTHPLHLPHLYRAATGDLFTEAVWDELHTSRRLLKLGRESIRVKVRGRRGMIELEQKV